MQFLRVEWRKAIEIVKLKDCVMLRAVAVNLLLYSEPTNT